MRIFCAGRDQRFAHFFHIASVGDADRNAKTHTRIAIGPVRYGRIDEFRVRHDRRDVVVRHYDRAARANLLHLADDSRDFDAVADGDRSLRQDDETADEIARDILQAEPDTHADGAGKNGQRAEMDAGVFQNDKNADDEDEVADDLRDGVLQGAIETAVDQKAIEEKALRARRNPEDGDEQRNEQKNLDETERDSWQRRVPREWNAGRIDRADGKENKRGHAQQSS